MLFRSLRGSVRPAEGVGFQQFLAIHSDRVQPGGAGGRGLHHRSVSRSEMNSSLLLPLFFPLLSLRLSSRPLRDAPVPDARLFKDSPLRYLPQFQSKSANSRKWTRRPHIRNGRGRRTKPEKRQGEKVSGSILT